MTEGGLAAIGRRLRRPVFLGMSTVLILIIVSLVADGIFWLFAYVSTTQNQAAFTQLAVGWTVAIVTVAAGWFLAAKSEAKSSSNKQRAAYEKFLAASDELVSARAEFATAESDRDAARTRFDAADLRASQKSDEKNLDAKLLAYAELTKAGADLDSATATAQDRLKAYRSAETAVAAVVTPSVRPAFCAFSKCPPEDTPARASARSSFVQAVQSDLGGPVLGSVAS